MDAADKARLKIVWLMTCANTGILVGGLVGVLLVAALR